MYGHGLYFADSREVAEFYRTTLGNRDSSGYASAHLNAQNIVARFNGDADWAAEVVRDQINNTPEADPNHQRLTATLGFIENGGYAKPLPAAGALYEVSIAPPEDTFLLWDKPLSEQSEKVRDALRRLDWMDQSVFAQYTGQQMYEGQVRDATMFEGRDKGNAQQEASSALLKAGIRGIKYLDGASRSVSGGKIVRVWEENGKWFARVKTENRGGAGGGLSAPTTQFTTSKPYATEGEAMAWAESAVGKSSFNYVIFDDADVEIVDVHLSQNGDIQDFLS